MTAANLEKTEFRAIHCHFATLLILAAHTAVSSATGFEFQHLADSLFALGAFVIMALGACFVLLEETEDKQKPADRLDLFMTVVTALWLCTTAMLGRKFDIGLVASFLAIYFWMRPTARTNSKYIAMILAAFAINILWAPVIFQLFKSHILVWESTFVSFLAAMLSYPVSNDGAFIEHETGLRLTLIGSCSIFHNLTASILVYTTVKALFRRLPSFSDIWFVAVLGVFFLIGNTFRIIAMTPSYNHYLYWHEGTGNSFFGWAQLIILIVLSVVFLHRKKVT